MSKTVLGGVVTAYNPGPPPSAEVNDAGPPPQDIRLDGLGGQEAQFELAYVQGGTVDFQYDTTSTGLNEVVPGSVTYHPPS